MRIYTYVIATDVGGAPNYDPPCITLAICKPKIRLAACAGDMIIAFNGSRLGHPHGVRWAGIVHEKLVFAEYWSDPRFGLKKPGAAAVPDNIYRLSDGELRQVPNPTHGPEHRQRDLAGRYVLAFDRSWRFWPSAPVMPDQFGLRMLSARRGHRVHYLVGADEHRLLGWLDGQECVPLSRTSAADAPGRRSCR